MQEPHIINLAIKCKDATGDDTKIVCMNQDYVVHISVTDCGTFSNAPVKKLVIRHNKEYYESDIKAVSIEGESVLQAVLPPIPNWDFVDLGVCGKEKDEWEEPPVYASTAARYACVKSVLSGTSVCLKDPVLSALNVTANGTYNAGDNGADGFYTVDVKVPIKAEESLEVEPFLTQASQVVRPTKNDRTLSEVTIVKPTTLIPNNIKKGVTIAGVVGSFEEEVYDGTITIEDIPPDEVFMDNGE